MKKLYTFFLMTMLTACAETGSIEFCGKHFKSPSDCETIGNMIRCGNYVFTWTYEPIADLPRHKEEMLAQLENPKEISVSVLGTDQTGYLSKVDSQYQLSIIGSVNGQGTLINLFLDKPITVTDDLPKYIKQLISIKPQ